jgi:hypothetical protein
MKVITLASLILITSSCKKTNNQCYHCTFGTFNGVKPPPQDYCGDDGGTRQFTDDQGNDLSSFCTPIP